MGWIFHLSLFSTIGFGILAAKVVEQNSDTAVALLLCALLCSIWMFGELFDYVGLGRR